jgi:ABC-type oligopeptide transport system ATPase subunit
MSAILEVSNLSRVYRRGGTFSRKSFAAVDDVSFTIEDRPQVFSIVGESGSGKTTLARMILRLVEPSSGEIRLLGRPLTGRSKDRIDNLEFRRLVQPIFQNPFEAFSAFLPLETYLKRTALNLRVAKTESQAAEAADDALRAVGLGLDRIAGKYIRQFSGGELQRISVARALIPNPKLIVADEPVSMVDASMRMNIVNLFKQIMQKKGVSFIYITHDLSTAYYLSDQVSIMNTGRVIEHGAPGDILDHPTQPYTRELMAAIPTIGARWSEIDDIDRKSAAAVPRNNESASSTSQPIDTTTHIGGVHD